jgi:hypothetical protein
MSQRPPTNRVVLIFQYWVGLIRAGSMLDLAAGILGLASVGIFLAHAVETYRAQ